ncbi:MAG TPA: hypothetical protein VFP84_03970 [Kofleriaceae bacterium]|nr:hypothetical protein [Kofleriaceae bacterium]
MRFNRSLLLASILALPATLIACGGDDGGNNNGGPDGGGNPPAGTHYGYVVNKANVAPTTAAGHTYLDYGLDLGSGTGPALDNKVDNQIGQALLALSGFFDIQGTVDTAINTGSIILLVDFQTADFANSGAAGLQVKFGANPTPAACTNPADPATCGQHLKGGASFTVAPNSPADAALTGKIVNGTFNSDSGNVSLAIAIGDAATPVQIDLVHARVKASTISADGIMTANVGGLVTQTALQTSIAPAILNSIQTLVTASGCKADGDPKANPVCGCTANTTGATVMGLLDGDVNVANKDCKITLDEVLGFPAVQAVLKPDACSQATCTAPDSYSLGVQVTAVKATIK